MSPYMILDTHHISILHKYNTPEYKMEMFHNLSTPYA